MVEHAPSAIHLINKRYFFEQLSFFAKNNEEAEKLLEISRPEGNDIFHSYVTREHRTFLEVLSDFGSAR